MSINATLKTFEEATAFVELQMNHKTEPTKIKSCSHYGWCEINELLDKIYGTNHPMKNWSETNAD